MFVEAALLSLSSQQQNWLRSVVSIIDFCFLDINKAIISIFENHNQKT
jgi:hypothetical protein